MGIDKEDKLMYKDIFPEMAEFRWVAEDFENLNCDVSIYKIYSSKKVEFFI
ncbi:hypothetical protein RG963_04680 [Methanosarcina sp. Z-7115]|uniref:Uncharacterized protein n=1 Tax=Methanosarcina baikalica TaxID=3073890 RepID=A0ABU2CZT3_9EURY|nr:hypothetical protein [Methanosarcina sp. Z-7115]MDR7665097.1 hypothetical protein [Methanosarcina sp. Z-7115]